MITTAVLVVDTDGDHLRYELGRLEEILLSVGEDFNDLDPERWVPPGSIVAGAGAAGELGAALRAAEDHPVRMVGPGSYELVPLLRVIAPPGAVDAVGAAVAELGRCLLPGGDEVLADALSSWASQAVTSSRADSAAADLVARAAQAHAMLCVPDSDDSAALRAGMPLMGEWHLSPDEVRAYRPLRPAGPRRVGHRPRRATRPPRRMAPLRRPVGATAVAMTDDELARRYQAREDLASLAASAGMTTAGIHARLRRIGVPAHMRPDRAHTLTAEQIAAALAAEGTVAGAARRVGAGRGAFQANAWRYGLLPLPGTPRTWASGTAPVPPSPSWPSTTTSVPPPSLDG